jgi:predicted nucleic acid-binding protein
VLSILDTSVLIAEHPAPIEGEIAISVVSIAELQFGVLVAPDDDRRARRLARLSRVLGSFEPLPVDAAVAVAMANWPRRRIARDARRVTAART